jgi:hypothetical protein
LTWKRTSFAAAAWLYFAGVVTQVFFAGAGLFELTDWTVHTALGWILGSAPLLLLVLALVARVDRRTAWLTAALAVAALVQPELAAARDDSPVVAAFHPVNALLVFWLAWVLARRSIARVGRADARLDRSTAVSTSDEPPAGGSA